jgi:hypothetical protein
VQRIRLDHEFEVAAAEDQEPVEALAADAADPALGVRSRLRRPYRRFDHTDALGAEDLVEVTSELAVAVTDEKMRADILVVEFHQQVARLVSHPGRKSHSKMLAACRRRNSAQLVSSRFGASSIPAF